MNESSLGVSSDLDVIDRYLNVNDKFLIDAGCGNMHLSKALADRGAHVLAIDPDPIQAEKNNKADTIANVGFVETGADAIPVEDHAVDGVLFPYSLHHIPEALHRNVFEEVLRILRPDGFLYVIEPVADGSLNSIMKLFHDESVVRQSAQESLDTIAAPLFLDVDVVLYSNEIKYESWEHFASRYAAKSFNTHYSEADIRRPEVEQMFNRVGAELDYTFNAPMRVTWMRNPVNSQQLPA